MPRRMIDPKIWFNIKVGNLPPNGRLLFIGIFSTADDDGRLEANPKFLKATIFPYDDLTAETVRELRDACTALGLIRVYSKNGREYLDIPGWQKHQKIRKDRYNPSTLPAFDNDGNQLTTRAQPNDNHITTDVHPTDNQVATIGCHSIVKSSLVKSNTPKGGRLKKPTDPGLNEIFKEMRNYLGYSEKVCGGEAVPALEESSAMTADRRIDPIPNYGKEGKAIKRMLTRGFTREEILACWKGKLSQRGGEFVSMTWVNEDIGKKTGGTTKARDRPELPKTEKLVRGWKSDRRTKDTG